MSRGGRPLDLPGLYWDEEKRRYFPIGSKLKAQVAAEKPMVKIVEDERPLGKSHGTPATGTLTARNLREIRRGGLSYSGLLHTAQYVFTNLLKTNLLKRVLFDRFSVFSVKCMEIRSRTLFMN